MDQRNDNEQAGRERLTLHIFDPWNAFNSIPAAFHNFINYYNKMISVRISIVNRIAFPFLPQDPHPRAAPNPPPFLRFEVERCVTPHEPPHG